MLTPKFEITQDDANLFIKIYINNIRFNTGNLDITINKNMMNFTLLPYYLRLRFNEKELLMSEEDIARENMIQEVTDSSTGVINKVTQEQPFECRLVTEDDGSECVVVKLFKLEKGVFFQDLDNHLTLLSRDNENMSSNSNESMLNIVNNNSDEKAKPLIQEMDDNVNDIEMISKLGDKFDWQIKQTLPKEIDSNYKKKIGFSLKHDATAIIPSIYNNNEINDVAEETINKQESQKEFEKELIKLRNYKDNLKFDADYYMNDYITYKYGQTTEMMQEDLEINGILKIIKYVPKDIKQFLQWAKLKQLDKPKFKDTLIYNSFEQEQMREKLPKNIKHDMSQFNQFVIPANSPLFIKLQRSPKNLNFDKLDETWKRNFVFIINVLFGYIYQEMEFDFDLEEKVVNNNSRGKKPKGREQTSERSWLIGKLAPQLGNLDQALILKPGFLKESCNWNPSTSETKTDDVDMEDDSGSNNNDFFIKEVVNEPNVSIEDNSEPSNFGISAQDELIKTSLIIAVKKSLSYPLHRNLQLSLKVIDYVNYSLISGSKFIIKLLLKIHELFRYDDVYYIYNKIWFDDLITWLLQFSDTNFHDLENSVVKGDEILDNIFRDMATKVSAISKSFKREDFDFMIIQDELNEQGDNIEWDSLNIAEIENIGDLKFKEFMGNSH
ncbi:hypothetical protein ACO0SA_001381 [Hanseniaspora valbyensis]